MQRHTLVCLVGCLLGCAGGPTIDSKPERPAPPSALPTSGQDGTPPAPVPRSAPPEGDKVRYEQEGFSLDTTGLALFGGLAEDPALRLSGPPGGLLSVELSRYWSVDRDHGQLRYLLENLRAPQPPASEWGADEWVTVAGAARPAVSWLSGSGMAAGRWCAVLLPLTPEGELQRTGLAPAGLLLKLGARGGGPAGCARVLEHPTLQAVVERLELRPPG